MSSTVHERSSLTQRQLDLDVKPKDDRAMASRILMALYRRNGMAAPEAMVRVMPEFPPHEQFQVCLRLHQAGLLRIVGSGDAQRVLLTRKGWLSANARMLSAENPRESPSSAGRLQSILQDIDDASDALRCTGESAAQTFQPSHPREEAKMVINHSTQQPHDNGRSS